jgi:hypothetical protein
MLLGPGTAAPHILRKAGVRCGPLRWNSGSPAAARTSSSAAISTGAFSWCELGGGGAAPSRADEPGRGAPRGLPLTQA